VDNTYSKVYFNFIDILYDRAKPKSFVRIYDNSLFVYEDGEIVYSQRRKKASYFKTIKKDNSLSNNFITMDLETKNIKGVLEPYCVSIFDGKVSYSFYITNYENSPDLMMKAALNFILKRKYNKNKIYIHNFSHFDGIFLMRVISEVVGVSNIKPIIRDNRIISVRLNFYNNYYVEFRDSYLLLNSSLENLGKTLTLNKGKYENKLSFPYKFVNEPDVNYDYVGEAPGLKYFDDIDSYTKFLDTLISENLSK